MINVFFSMGLYNWLYRVKTAARNCGRVNRSGGKNKEQRLIEQATNYLTTLYDLELKVEESSKAISEQNLSLVQKAQLAEIIDYHQLLVKFIDQITRRLLNGEKIPQEEKLYSIFERHTEWIAKGKMRPNVELGHRLLITTDTLTKERCSHCLSAKS